MKRVVRASCRVDGSTEQLYKDPNSVLGLSPDSTISESELEDMWDNNFLDDYTMEDFYNEFGEHQGKKEWIKETKKFLVPVESGTDLPNGDYIKARYELLDRKDVLDFDGFYTKYSMYKDTEDDRYVFVFGDPDIYRPEDEDFDYECESESEAYEWFDSYRGADEEDDIHGCS